MDNWEIIYQYFGIQNIVYILTSSELQRAALPLKLVFIFFAVAFLAIVIYFYVNSTYIKYQFLQDTVEFLSWQPYGLRQVGRRWKKIMERIEEETESEYKLAILDADDLLHNILEDRAYDGDTFEELLNEAAKEIQPGVQEISFAHDVRNSIVHDPNYKLDIQVAKKVLADYEKAVKNL